MTDDPRPATVLPMRASPTIAALFAALAKAQGAFPEIEKAKRADIATKAGGHFSYAYADLSQVLAAVRAPLAANELALLQPVAVDGRAVRVTTLLAHSSGEWVATELALPIGEASDARAIASTITYCRRYAAISLLSLSPGGEDDDGADAVTRAPREKPKKEERSVERPPSPSSPPSAPPSRRSPGERPGGLTVRQYALLHRMATQYRWSKDQLHELIEWKFGYTSETELQSADLDQLLMLLPRTPSMLPPPAATREPGDDDVPF